MNPPSRGKKYQPHIYLGGVRKNITNQSFMRGPNITLEGVWPTSEVMAKTQDTERREEVDAVPYIRVDPALKWIRSLYGMCGKCSLLCLSSFIGSKEEGLQNPFDHSFLCIQFGGNNGALYYSESSKQQKILEPKKEVAFTFSYGHITTIMCFFFFFFHLLAKKI